MSKEQNILEEEKIKRADILALNITNINNNGLEKINQYDQLKNEMQEEILRLKPIIDDLTLLYNIGTVDERKEIHPKLIKLEVLVHKMKNKITIKK